ncbi:hypothetical protein G5B31_20740 [Rhodobacter sp. SGA-6-6]|uniref:hypothetical protein n=1 Tax=Rhodobacter sp. SGA-6-6 TaxID=2710882 RepID=UPI0013EDE928|nr:hypothetical protein [Rhodobacter sp. SGA-6-6]NGM47948.1 hypothetical protein [Rhodobacter sp. SGA-6-6]
MIADLLKTFRKSQANSMSMLDLLDQARDAVAQAVTRRDAVLAAPVDIDTAMNSVDHWLDRAATEAIDRLGLEHAAEPGWQGPELPIFTVVGESVHETKSACETLFGLLCLTARDQLRQVVKGQIEDRMLGQTGMNAATRAKRLAEAERDILEAELAEEALIRSMEASGIAVARRPDASPIALLAADASLPG